MSTLALQQWNLHRWLLLIILLIGGIGLGALLRTRLKPDVADQPSTPPQVLFNQSYVEQVRNQGIDLQNPEAVFALVFSQLPPKVTVYPTENYYYFRFFANGQEAWGNLRLDADEREQGKLSFGYFSAHNAPQRREDLQGRYAQLSEEQGVQVEQVDALHYRVTFRGKTVEFALNDLPQTVPAGMQLQESEQFMARTFDESGFQLVLLFDTEAAQFRFLLDETVSLPDTLEPLDKELHKGRLSGFVFYQDEMARKILVGVDQSNVRRNNYFDGPFDQLADNFVTGDTLKQAMEQAYPYVRGRINERGVFLNQQGERTGSRLAITPYHTYSSLAEMSAFLKNCQRAEENEKIVHCLTYDSKKQARAPRDAADSEER